MSNEKRNTAIMDKVKRYTQHHTATPNLAQEAIERIAMTNDKDSAMPSMKIQSSETFKELFTLNGEEIVLAVDDGVTMSVDGVTMSVGSVSPSMGLTVSTLAPSNIAPPLISFTNQQNDEPVMTIHPDGKITLGEKADPTEAAAACIEAMSGKIQDMIKNAVLREQSK